MKVEYSSNNSGGDWWLKRGDWEALEKAGWRVEWGGLYFCNSKYPGLFGKGVPERYVPCPEGAVCHGHRMAESADTVKELWLGAHAKRATLECGSRDAAVESWEETLGMDASEEGCSCCGAPHYFSIVHEVSDAQ